MMQQWWRALTLSLLSIVLALLTLGMFLGRVDGTRWFALAVTLALIADCARRWRLVARMLDKETGR